MIAFHHSTTQSIAQSSWKKEKKRVIGLWITWFFEKKQTTGRRDKIEIGEIKRPSSREKRRKWKENNNYQRHWIKVYAQTFVLCWNVEMKFQFFFFYVSKLERMFENAMWLEKTRTHERTQNSNDYINHSSIFSLSLASALYRPSFSSCVIRSSMINMDDVAVSAGVWFFLHSKEIWYSFFFRRKKALEQHGYFLTFVRCVKRIKNGRTKKKSSTLAAHTYIRIAGDSIR